MGGPSNATCCCRGAVTRGTRKAPRSPAVAAVFLASAVPFAVAAAREQAQRDPCGCWVAARTVRAAECLLCELRLVAAIRFAHARAAPDYIRPEHTQKERDSSICCVRLRERL